MRKDFGANPWFYPLPVLIIGTYDENGKPDTMNAAWGSHDQSPAHYAKLLEQICAEGLEAAGPSREIALIDNSISDDPETFVTEIAVPVRSRLYSGKDMI